jgi:hypothetical protein
VNPDTYSPRCVTGEDNRPSIQSAIDEAHANGGGVVALPPGNWPLSGSLFVTDNVTLRGAGLTATTLTMLGEQSVPFIVVDPKSGRGTGEGWAVEWLGFDGSRRDEGPPPSHGVLVMGGSSYAILRRLRIRNVSGHAVVFRKGQLNYVFLEELFLESPGRGGIWLSPSRDSSGIFLSDIVIRDFGKLASDRACAAISLKARCHISQLHIEPVAAGHIGIHFDSGSDQTVVSGMYIGLSGGEARTVAPNVEGICISTEAVRRLQAA